MSLYVAPGYWTAGYADGETGGSTAYSLTADYGSYSLTGQDATFAYVPGATNYSLLGAFGSYSLAGQAATFSYVAGPASYALTADVGSYSLNGRDAGLSYAPGAGSYSLTAEFGSYSLSGVDVSVNTGRNLPAEFGSYGFTGQAAGVVVGRRVAGEFGAYALTGQGAALTASGGVAYSLRAGTGLYSIDGQGAGLSGPAVSGGHGFVLVDFEPRLWWKRKPKALDEQEAAEKVASVARQIERVAVKQVKAGRVVQPVVSKPAKAEILQAIAPQLQQMPGFDPVELYRAILERLIQQEQQRQAELQAQQIAAQEIERIRLMELDEDETIILLMGA